jgi:hypothetical protein
MMYFEFQCRLPRGKWEVGVRSRTCRILVRVTRENVIWAATIWSIVAAAEGRVEGV